MKVDMRFIILLNAILLLPCLVPLSFGRDPALWPFSADDPWNRSIGSEVRYAEITGAPTLTPISKGSFLNCLKFSIPVFIAKEGDPVREVCTWYGGKGGQFLGSIRIPDDAKPDYGSDKHLCVIDERHGSVVEMGLVERQTSGNYSSWAAFKNDLKGSAFYPNIHGVRCHGGSALGGLIRKGELKNGIPHALALATDPKNLNSKAPGGKTYIWPACSSDYEFPGSLWPEGKKPFEDWYGKSSNIYIGSLLIIPADVDISKIGIGDSGPTYQIAKALQDYGAYVVDMAGAPLAFYLEPAASSELGDAETLKTHGGGSNLELDKLLPHIRVVTNSSPESIGGGGVPRRPAAPPFDVEFK